MEKIIEVKNLKKDYKNSSGKEPVKALNGVDLAIEKGEVVGLIGESGSGKSTLGNIIVGLEKPTEGEILYEGKKQKDLLKKSRTRFYKDVQMIFQNPYDVFDPNYPIKKVLEDPLRIHGIGEDRKDRLKIMKNVLEIAGLKPATDFLLRYPRELSGGQLQRIAILRSIILNPKLLVADEAVTSLDVSVRSEIINFLMEMKEKYETSILFISHDIATTSFISKRIVVMYLGQIVEEAKTDDILDRPIHPYTKALISNTNSIIEDRKIEPIRLKGDPPSPVGLGNKCYFSNRCNIAREKCFNHMPELEELADGSKVRCFYKNG